LYERWSEDRQAAAQRTDMAELVRFFTLQVESFKELEPTEPLSYFYKIFGSKKR
jgi:hypothetical protein